MPEFGAAVAELAEREGIAPSYLTRVLRLTLLAPDIVDAILDGTHGPKVTLARALEPFPARFSGRFSDLFSTWVPILVLIPKSSRDCLVLIQFFWRLLAW